MGYDELYETAQFQISVREVLCTIIMMNDVIEISEATGAEHPFELEKRGEFNTVKKLYRRIYKPKYMTATMIDEAVKRALVLYKEVYRNENRKGLGRVRKVHARSNQVIDR